MNDCSEIKWPVYRTDAQICRMFKSKQEAIDFVKKHPSEYFLGWNEEESVGRGKLALVEKERDAERAQNAVLRGALERCRKAFNNLIDLSLLPGEEYEKETHNLSQMCYSTLSATPHDSAAKVQKLVDALEKTRDYMDSCMDAETGYNEAMSAARKALAEWRDEE